MKSLIKQTLQGEQKAGAQIIRLIEEEDENGIKCLKELYPQSGNTPIVGLTGPPGVGKSTIIDHILTEFQREDLKIGVIAIDPTSPYTGGAILGDRVRMNRHSEDLSVFIRSMATRGYQGGLSKAALGAMIVMGAMKHDIVIVETTGVGQDETEIRNFAHTTVVVMIPGMGDQVQSMKAGILEIGDIFVINKCDRPDASQTMEVITHMLNSRTVPENGWHPKLVGTIATKHEGIPELIQSLKDHRRFLEKNENLEAFEIRRAVSLYKKLVKQHIMKKTMDQVLSSREFIDSTREIKNREIDPFSAMEELKEQLKIVF